MRQQEATSRTDILAVPYGVEYDIGAENAVRICLDLQAGESFLLIADRESLEIAASVAHAAARIGCAPRSFILEDFGERPMLDLPDEILEAFAHADVSIYTCTAQPGELNHRMQMMERINRFKPRHGHMVNINRRIMLEGMRADFIAVDALSQRVLDLARNAARITAKTRYGTDIEATFDPELRWLKTSGIISREKWGNLPGGEVFTSPLSVNGTYIADGVVGDWLCKKYGDLSRSPLRIEIEDSRIRHCECDDPELLKDFLAYCSKDENSDRVGEFAIGTNTALKNISGNILQDEKMPGIHLAFGHPYSEHTGARWRSSSHIDVVGREFTIRIEDRLIMEKGTFLI